MILCAEYQTEITLTNRTLGWAHTLDNGCIIRPDMSS